MNREEVLAMILISCSAIPRNYVNACVRHRAMKREGVLAMILIWCKTSPRNCVNAMAMLCYLCFEN